MFGYIIANFEDISADEKARYQELYCGLCRSVEERYGQLSRACLNYDLTFVALLFDSLYEPVEDKGSGRCIMHPKQKQDFARSRYTDYAADLTIAFAYHKFLDDWHDDKKVSAYSYAKMLEAPYLRACERIPAQCEAIETALADIRTMEEAENTQPDDAANRFGVLMGDLLAYERDIWADALQEFGFHFGRFIYLMDAAVDYEEDEKSGSYNPFVELGTTPANMKILLTGVIGNTTEAFEKLPLVQDDHLLRSVLYAGVWQKFNVAYGTGLSVGDNVNPTGEQAEEDVVGSL